MKARRGARSSNRRIIGANERICLERRRLPHRQTRRETDKETHVCQASSEDCAPCAALTFNLQRMSGLHRHRQLEEEGRKRRRNKSAELKGFRFHDLRHTAIKELAEAGALDATLTAPAGHMTRRMSA